VSIGISVTGTDRTRIRIETASLFEPPLPGYEIAVMYEGIREPGGGFGARGNVSSEAESYGRFTEQWGHLHEYDNVSILRTEAENLKAYFRGLDNGILPVVRDSLMEVLHRAGRRVTFMGDRSGEQDGTAAGFDVIMTIECRWYGVICHYTNLNPDFTDVEVQLQGIMVDAGSGDVLWRSPWKRVRVPAPCRCGKPGCLPVITEALDRAAVRAVEELVGDLVKNRP
jgi:hypothetical protein